MKLSYRGIHYDEDPLNLEFKEGTVVGKYRGQDWNYHYPRHIPQLQPKIFMQYRGVAYSTCPLPKKEGCEEYLWESGIKSCRSYIPENSQVVNRDTGSIHLENIRRNLERRLQIAKANGDHNLVNLLRKECKQLSINVNC
jgi:hypothetical protein